MEFEFRRDMTGTLQASFSMGHEAIAAWLLEEVGSRLSVISELEPVITQLQAKDCWEYLRDGVEYHLKLTRTEAEVTSASVDFDCESDLESHFDNDLDYYDEESRSTCGLDDFSAMLQEWKVFVSRA